MSKSGPQDFDHEADRIQEVYSGYDRSGRVQRRRDPGRIGNVLANAERRSAVESLLSITFTGHTPRAIVDIGCGTGQVLEDVSASLAIDQGRLSGVDLLEDRVAAARQRLPGAAFEVASATSLPQPDRSTDLVLLFTVLSSVTDGEVRSMIAGEAWRILRPRGMILVYDMRYPNPFNRNIIPITKRMLGRLFPHARLESHSVTLIPQLARALPQAVAARSYPLLAMLPMLRSHRLTAIRHPGHL